ncbi:uromodulin-like [Anomaloglossus baeobatrachus]|uniref:uromodulin-like n=1 Tax=Anomaloglossus baeobatrachus TaxID=238106 RepID=UPI003F4F9178
MPICLRLTFFLCCVFHLSSVSITAGIERSCATQIESSSLTYLVDTTGSMSDDFIELKAVNSWLLDRVTARFPCGVRQYTMVEFNDPTVGPVRITQSKNEFDDFFNNLVATGGGDCPELAMQGLKLSLENTPPDSFILVLTDASALDYWNTTLINHIYSLIASSRSQVFFLITGLCGSINDADFLIYREIAAASFGHVFQVSLSDLNKVFHYLDLTLARPLNSSVRLFSGEYSYGHNNTGSFTVEDNFTALIITTDGLIYSIQVLGPDSLELPLKQIISELWGSMYLLKNPGHGRWTIVIYAGGRYSLRVEGLKGLNISSAENCSKCHPFANCEEYFGSVECNCKDGFIGDGFNCSDIDECAYSWSNNCSDGMCQNTFGSYSCDCPSGFIFSSMGYCVDIDECSSPELNRCHSSASCINYYGNYSCVCPYGYFGDGFHCEVDECTNGFCGLGIECIKSPGSYSCSDPCSDHTVLEEPWRSTSNMYDSKINCDYDKQGWYRFVGSGGVRMPESCAPEYGCGTHAGMWLRGTHPMLRDGVVNHSVCASWLGSCCYWSTTVLIKTCPGGYHVYKLDGTPACYLSYCTDPSTANNSSICAADEEWKLKDGVYGCFCKDEYEVTALADIRPELTCDLYEMRAVFQKCQLTSLDFNANSVTLRDDGCYGIHHDPSRNSFTVSSPIHAGACRLQITKNGTHVTYLSTLHLMLESTGLITRDEELSVTIFCSYPLDMMVSLNMAVKPFFSSTNITVGGTGQFTAYMAIYKDSSYVTPYEGSEVELSTKSMLYIGVFVQGGDAFNYALVMRNCYATPSRNPDDSLKYYIIKDSCPNKQDSTISVPENGVSRKGRLSVQVFKFVGNHSSVYIHCAVSLCDVTAGSCAPSCSGIRSQSSGDEKIYQISLGPIRRKDEVITPPPSGCTGIHESSVLFGFVFLLMTTVWFN